MTIFASLLDPRVALAEMKIGSVPRPLMRGEELAVANVVPKRRREYAAGRACARDALAALGVPPTAIPTARDRTPVWPAGLVGSITHDDGYAAAAVARAADGIRGIGIDLEPCAPLPDGIRDTICRTEEIAWLDVRDAKERGVLARTLFSAKEAAFKCQFPLTARMLEFHDVAVQLDPENGAFSAAFLDDAVAAICGREIAGRMKITAGHVACAAVLERR